MKAYTAHNRLPLAGTTLLVTGSIALGVTLGAMAYLISNFLYLIVAFSLIIGVAIGLVFYRLLQFTKVRHSLISAIAGFVTGLLVTLTYYGTPYLVVRHNFIVEAQDQYLVDAETASIGFNSILINDTGSSGFFGFMKLRAIEGDQYSSTMIINSMPIGEFNFTLKSSWAWLYWLLEFLLFSIPATWIGFDVGKRDFNESANDWYEELPKQIGSVPLERKEELSGLLYAKDLHRLIGLVCSEDELTHPVLEIYKQVSKNKKGDILLSIKQTTRVDHSKIKTNILSRWEIPQEEFALLMEGLESKLNIYSALDYQSTG